MAKLSESLIKEFAKMTNDVSKSKKSEIFVYGTVDRIESSGDTTTAFVLFDGATDSTPCYSTVSIAKDDRVLVLLKNRQAVITSNISNPTISGDAVFTGSIKVLGSDSGGLVQQVGISPDYGPAISVTGNMPRINVEYTCNIRPTGIRMDEDDNDHIQSMSIDPSSLSFSNNFDDFKASASANGFRAQVGTGAQIRYSELTFSGVETSSDARLKKDIEPISSDLALKLRPVKFRFKEDDSIHYGFIAQDVQTVLPDAVHNREGYLSLNYSELIAPILSLVQNLERRVKELESKCNKELPE